MKSSRLLDRRLGFSLASLGMLLGIASPALVPAFASADVLTSRSITMSNATADATGVSYTLKFTAPVGGDIDGTASSEGGIAIGFCAGSPLLGAACSQPAGLSTAGVAATDVEYAGVGASDDGTASALNFNGTANSGIKWVAGADYTGGTTLEMTLTGIHNPTAAGTFYARITTYANNTTLPAAPDFDTLGTYQDDGAVALSTSNNIGVTAYVLESMTFCVSKGDVGDTGDLDAVSTTAAPGPSCSSVTAPSMTLGQVSGSVNALSSSAVSTGQVYAQLSTNASGGAIVNLKSDAEDCGGLYRNGVSDAGHCNIGPQDDDTSATVAAGTAKFGLRVGSAAAAAGAPASGGTLQIATGSNYDATEFYIDALADNTAGVTSPYGSPLLDTNGTQTSDLNIPITFGASISGTTPAGSYGANLNMIATGTF